MAAILIAALSQMVRTCEKYDPPFIASISKSGQVDVKLN
jgi:hypothetical protein